MTRKSLGSPSAASRLCPTRVYTVFIQGLCRIRTTHNKDSMNNNRLLRIGPCCTGLEATKILLSKASGFDACYDSEGARRVLEPQQEEQMWAACSLCSYDKLETTLSDFYCVYKHYKHYRRCNSHHGIGQLRKEIVFRLHG